MNHTQHTDTGTYTPPPTRYAHPPDSVLTVLEAIRDLADQELARIERDGGCCAFAQRVRALVRGVLW